MKLHTGNLLVAVAFVATGCAGITPRADTASFEARGPKLFAKTGEWTEVMACDDSKGQASPSCYPFDQVDWNKTTVCVRQTVTGSHIAEQRCQSLRAYISEAAGPKVSEKLRSESLTKLAWANIGRGARMHVVPLPVPAHEMSEPPSIETAPEGTPVESAPAVESLAPTATPAELPVATDSGA